MRKKEGERDWERTGRREKPTGTENKRRENSTKLWNFQKQMTMVTNWHTWASWNRSWPFRKPRCCLIHNAELPKSLGTGTTRCFGTVSKTGVKNSRVGTSLVVEWLRISLPMQEMQVWFLIWQLKSHTLRATNPDRSTKDPACPTKTRCSPPKIKRMIFFFKFIQALSCCQGNFYGLALIIAIYRVSTRCQMLSLTHTLNHWSHSPFAR